MVIIVGLGNPGGKFQKTRHNAGFMAIDEFARKNNFPDFRMEKKLQAEISESEIDGQKIILAKPQTFMNESGRSVKSLTKTYNLEPKNLIILHDDIDLPLGKIRISIGRGAAGHKGVESAIQQLGTKDFKRIRIGIQPKIGKPKNVEDFVLKKFSENEEKIIKESIQKSVIAVETAVKEGMEKIMTKFNK